jgi:predicted ATPase/DNA-binding winged helix-turn-helix (wHTH) protein
MQVRLLGPLLAETDGAQAALGGRQRRAVLALLALAEGRVVSVDTLIEALWGERAPASAANTVQVHVSALRKALGGEDEVIVREGAGYRLALPPSSLDHVRFGQLAAEAEELLARGHAERARVVFIEALALWNGPALADFEYESWAQPEAARLEDGRLACLEGRLDAELACGYAAELVGELELLACQHPQRERFSGQLMLALYRSGRQAEALDVYQQARQRLLDELGIEPSPALQELHRQILNQDESLAAPVRAMPDGEVRLPVAPTPLIGRRQELAELGELIGDRKTRLITVLGPGGVGKTRLALAASEAAVEGFPDGVNWVALHALSDPRLVSPTIAQTLGSATDPAEAIGGARMLLALDNFEQVVEAALDVAALVAACPNLTVLVTSREPLHVAAEHEYPVAALSEPDAVTLFTARARTIRPEIEGNGEVAAICERLDRLPLALELAAARVNVLSLEGILERLDQRLGVLTRAAKDVPSRHQTLRRTIDWSYALLDETEQLGFARLGVFSGGWTLEAAETICGLDLDALASLIDKSLVRRRARGSDGGTRYGMLATIREYALERLDEVDPEQATARQHADFFLELAERAYPNLRGAQSAAWLNRIEHDHDNMRAALEFALVQADAGTAIALAGALARYWMVRGQLSEGRRWLEAALALPGQPAVRPRALRGLALLDLEQGELEQPQALAEEALALALENGDAPEAARAAGLLADAAWYRGDLDTAQTRYEQAVTEARAGGDELELAINLHNLGEVHRTRDELDAAETCLQESLRIATELQDNFGQAGALLGLVYVADMRIERELGLSLLTQATELLLGIRHVGGIAECLVSFGKLTAESGDPASAARAWGAASALGAEIGRDLSNPAVATAQEDAVADARSVLGDEAFDRIWSEGERLSLEEAATIVLEWRPR